MIDMDKIEVTEEEFSQVIRQIGDALNAAIGSKRIHCLVYVFSIDREGAPMGECVTTTFGHEGADAAMWALQRAAFCVRNTAVIADGWNDDKTH